MAENGTNGDCGVVGGGGGGGGRGDCMTSHVDEGSAERHRYYLSRRTVLEMLRDRGYVVPDSELARSLAEFRSAFGDKPDLLSLRITVPHSSNPYNRVFIHKLSLSLSFSLCIYVCMNVCVLMKMLLVKFCLVAEIIQRGREKKEAFFCFVFRFWELMLHFFFFCSAKFCLVFGNTEMRESRKFDEDVVG